MKIPWNILSDIAGVLGFLGSIFVFIITRLERKKKVTFLINSVPMPQEDGLPKGKIDAALMIQITSSSIRPLTLDTSSLQITTRRLSLLSNIQLMVVGVGEGRYRKLSQADNLRFICKLSDFLLEAERLGFKDGIVPLEIIIQDSEGKKYKQNANYDIDNLRMEGRQLVVMDAEPKDMFVNYNYPKESGLRKKMELEGFTIAWVSEERLQLKISEGWEEVVVADRGKRYKLKMKEKPSDKILIRKLNTK